MSLAAEAKLGALFIHSKLAIQLHHALAKMGHPQPPMLVQSDDSTTYGAITNKIIPRATKVIDSHFHWLHNHKQQQHFRFYWWLGKTNYTNCWTKCHPAAYHKLM